MMASQPDSVRMESIPPDHGEWWGLDPREHASPAEGERMYGLIVDELSRLVRAAPVSGKNYRQVILRLGPLAIVPFPGEPFADIVLRLRDLSPAQYTLCASTSCGSNGYLVTRESLHRGGYEVWVARAVGAYILAENIDDVLVEENMRLLTQAYA